MSTPAICGVVSFSGPIGEPLACGFVPDHEGDHAWASQPTWRFKSDPDKTTRCIQCDAEFSEADLDLVKEELDLKQVTCCPRCQTRSIPCDISRDLYVPVNWQELRILCMWATNWADKLDDQAKATMAAIVRRLEAQRKDPRWPALTLLGELRELKAEGHDIEAFDSDGKLLIGRGKKGEA